MSEIPANLRYFTNHEWADNSDEGTILVGITDFAQKSLGDVVYVELPEVGDEVVAQEEFAIVESVKAASDIYAPVSGEVVEVNDALDGQPELVNDSPYQDGWLVRIKPSDPAELDDSLDAEAYAFATES